MSTLFWIGITAHVFLCFFLILLVLLQNDKMGGLAGLAGGMQSSAFSGAGAATFVQKLTRGVALAFMVLVLGLSVLATQQETVQEGSDLKKAAQSSGLGSVLPQGITDIQTVPAAQEPSAP